MATVTPPTNIGYGTVTGQFLLDVVDSADAGQDPDFVAAVGTILFQASVPKVLDAGATPNPVTIVRYKIQGVLDSSGYLCTPLANGSTGARGLKLIATNDADLNPVDWTWNVSYSLAGPDGKPLGAPRAHSMALPEGTTVDLTTVQPVESSTGSAIIVGPQGPQGVPGLRGSKWFVGHGTPTAWATANPGVFAGALPDDQYLDEDTGNTYTFS